ncbi:MAG TPA: serine/threonine protein kinase [Cyanobacteria bacterium UBA11369]|nr:serine/threonine protein kinase [Cyanobacteria bacterium UBA11371]HBE51291.1 serine/threonine protein kinase [Cyanobacteria bacterium UBA11369]
MQPPLPIGTVVQNRYRLLKILGQGGFGRTYLAEDIGRFKERCALKEFIPVQTGAYTPEKSKELFQREAATLYQIQHPQIPQFRATIEQDGRLFLVQDYVEGKTYSTLLTDRKSQGKRLSEAEVLQLLQQMLPVLDHIHAKGIVHRDISPDNIILRASDRLPVLIDFGVVKELVTRFQFPQKIPTLTTVGKMGYAPPEQIQTGRAYPSSDLYALAVTCAVLLTGIDPQDLYDEASLTWTWYRWIPPVNPGLTAVLNRMLSYKPSDRYSDAREVAIALKSAYNNPGASKIPPTHIQALPDPQSSQIQTLAVNRAAAIRSATVAPTAESQYASNQPNSVIPLATERSSWDNPLLVTFVGMFLAILAGVGSWAIVSTILNNQPQVKTLLTPIPAPTVFDSPTDSTPTPTSIETPTPTLEPEPVTINERLNLLPGDSLSTPGNLKANETLNYIINGTKGQQLSASLEEEGVLIAILGPNEEPIDDRSTRVTRWEGVLPEDGNYIIQLRTVRGVEDGPYRLNLRLTNPEPTPTPTETPTPTPTPTETPTPTPTLGENPFAGEEFKVAPPATNEYDEEPLDLPPGDATAQISGRTSQRRIKRYLVYAQAGQVLSARIQTGAGAARLDIRYPNGQLVENASALGEWEGKVDSSGEYKIDVTANEATNFTIEVNVRQ